MSTVPTRTINANIDGASVNITYQHHPHHRNGNPNKSQWIINYDEEFSSFQLTFNNRWIEGLFGWGLHLVNNKAHYLGLDPDQLTQLFIAKYVGDAHRPEWHGYPANHSRDMDRPPTVVLNTWLNDRILPASKISKIVQGKPCKLSN